MQGAKQMTGEELHTMREKERVRLTYDDLEAFTECTLS